MPYDSWMATLTRTRRGASLVPQRPPFESVPVARSGPPSSSKGCQWPATPPLRALALASPRSNERPRVPERLGLELLGVPPGAPGRRNGKDGPARQRAAMDGSRGASGLGFSVQPYVPCAHGGACTMWRALATRAERGALKVLKMRGEDENRLLAREGMRGEATRRGPSRTARAGNRVLSAWVVSITGSRIERVSRIRNHWNFGLAKTGQRHPLTCT